MKNLEILLDKYVFCPGEEVSGQVMFRTDKPIKTRNVRLRIMGIERTRVVEGYGEDSYTYVSENHMIDIRDRLMERSVLPPGEYGSTISFRIPESALPTYNGRNATVYYMIKARVDVPLWFDVKTQKTFWVLYDSEKIQQSAAPVSFASKYYHENIKPSSGVIGILSLDKPKPGMLIELDKNILLAGDDITGRITIKNPTQKTIRKVKVLLRAKEYANAQGHSKYITLEKYKYKIERENIIEDIPFVFTIPIPRTVKTSYLGSLSRCDWFLEFQLDIALGFDVKVKHQIKIYQWK